MLINQHTIKKPVSVSGVGLHTGIATKMTFLPANSNHGIKFQRIDLEGEPIIEADVDNVVDISRGTTIEKNGARVSTVEHVLAALVGLEIDNILIQIDGPETPIMDGSSKMFIEALEKVGLEDQKTPRNFLEISEGIFYKDPENDVEMAALPLDDYRVTVMVDYNSPVLGSQHASLNKINNFTKEIASCRTFCFLHELEMLHKNDLIKGGDLNNAIVVVDKIVDNEKLEYLASLFNNPKIEVKKEGILNNVELRYKNEPARHKLLDVVGDLALIGQPIKAQILAAKPGHAANVAFAKKIKHKFKKFNNNKIPKYNPKAPPVMDINKLSAMLPHRYPFQLIDKIIYIDEKSIVGVKNVTINEPFFQGHFPGNPVMPGVLQVEAMAQTGGVLVLSSVDNPEAYSTYFLGIDDCRFRKKVLPGDTLIIKCEFLAPTKRGISKMQGFAYVGDDLVCEAKMTAIISKDR